MSSNYLLKDSPLTGHFEQEKASSLISRDVYWPGMTNDVKDYVSCCYECSCNKSSNHRKYGFLKPLPIPPIPWHSCSMDFFSQLPLSNGITFFCLLFPWAFY
ncbi:retrotransposon nucleocapsid protein [Puccinia sorghi]|uniref:Retrotransposon nucleocapsid protein n=1 Tax=Puccinia sorghi TaxID=27349 RepID=A0A0L6VDD0_9BASI|nr:retrotransposon nucleocapsid protein [Puccinia sorghi]